MNVAIPVWSDSISPVFDASQSICLIVLDEAGHETGRRTVEVPVSRPAQRVRLLVDAGAEVLICGAISTALAERVKAVGIRLIPFVTGNVESVLAGFLRGELPSPTYTMPGCGGRRHRRRGCCNRESGTEPIQ